MPGSFLFCINHDDEKTTLRKNAVSGFCYEGKKTTRAQECRKICFGYHADAKTTFRKNATSGFFAMTVKI